MAEDKDKKPKGDINFEYGQGFKGLNMDNIPSQIDKGALSYALNASIENFDANSITYQNEPANEFCLEFPNNYILIGKYFIPEQAKQIFFLSNPSTGDSEIGYMINNDCTYRTLVNSKCLNFDPNFPIHKAVHKTSNCGTELYWAQPNADRRYINLDPDKIPRLSVPGSTPCDGQFIPNSLDCNQLRVQPNYNIPQIAVKDVIIGGNLIAGTYQFCIQYADAMGNPLSSAHSITNPTPIADPLFTSVNYNYPVGKSIVVDINNIDTGGQFDYFNLIVIKSINAITSVDLIGTYNIDSAHKVITYAGQNQTAINLTVNDVFEKFPFYGPADDVTTAQNVLIWKGLSSPERVSYQQIANQITLLWETYRIPPSQNYSDEMNATHLRGYLRDEVYPFEFVPLLKSGKQCDGFHIPGRPLSQTEKAQPDIHPSDQDFIEDPDGGPVPYWKIYNTATVIGISTGMPVAPNYKGPYNYGAFAYWESEETYPCDTEMWGDLAGQPIRHHKFPDVEVSPIIESKQYNGSLEMGNVATFPIGVRIDVDQVKLLISQSSLTPEQKADIVGFKIVRGDRTDNKSIVGKGILRNVGKYTREDQEFYFPNYPYNDLREDPFLGSINNSYGLEASSWLVICSETGTFQIGDVNTNKPAIRNMTAGQTLEVCSVTRPITISGKALIGPSQYDVYSVEVGSCTIKVEWTDPFTDNNTASVAKTKTIIKVLGGAFNIIYCRVAKGATITKISCVNIGGCICANQTILIPATGPSGEGVIETGGGGTITEPRISRTTLINCTGGSGLKPITEDPDLARRQIFNSPETSFGQPFLGDVLKLESVLFGKGQAHFVKVKDNAEYRLLTQEAQEDALKSAGNVGNGDATATFTAYQAYLEIYVNGITRKNYGYSFNSVADYNYSVPVPDAQGIKQRTIDLKRYLIPAVLNIGETNIEGETVDINNYQRETSVYLRTPADKDPLPFPHLSPNMLPVGIQEFSRFIAGCSGVAPCSATTTSSTTLAPGASLCKASCAEPEKKQDIQVVSYYASLKNTFRGQWGQIYSYQTIDTGFQVDFDLDNTPPTPDSLPSNIIFGGDTFICRFGFKTKLPFFIDNRVGAPDDSEIFYDELGNIGYPKFWHSGRSILKNFNVPKLGEMNNIISYKAHNFDCPNCQNVATTDPNRTFYDGMFYLFAYGIPNFYVESSYNIDLRQAYNIKEGDFWPHVSNSIPDDWVQESYVSIANDNTYFYNGSFSKQNTENLFTHIPAGYQFDKCSYEYPFRAIFSDPQVATTDVTVNNWLTYRAVSHFDFPQNYGKLTSLDGIERGQVLARFENKTLYYNALYTTQTNTNGQVYLGQSLFSKNTPPIDLAETDLGYIGSQHKFLLKIPQGQITVDAARGQIFLLGGGIEELSGPSSGMNRFFTDHLSFEILRFFPDVNVDNHFNGIGLHGVYDSKYDRVIITKLDYIPLNDNIKYDNEAKEFYIETQAETGSFRTKVFLSDTSNFCNKSWTLSFSFVTKSWLSFHSYLPNWYIGENNFFYSGLKDCCNPVDFIAGELVSNPVTTTTTSTFPVPATTTSTTTTPADCNLIGGQALGTNCELAGTGLITVLPVPPPCTRPGGLTEINLYTGYEIISPPITVVSTLSATDACNAKQYIFSNSATSIPTAIVGVGMSLTTGQKIYANNGLNDCAPAPDGFYYTIEFGDPFIYQISGGIVTTATPCVVSTTTTTTTCNMYLYTFEVYACTTCTQSVTGTLGNSELLTVGKFYYDSVTAAKIKIISFDGCSAGSDRTILDSTKQDSCPAVSCP